LCVELLQRRQPISNIMWGGYDKYKTLKELSTLKGENIKDINGYLLCKW